MILFASLNTTVSVHEALGPVLTFVPAALSAGLRAREAAVRSAPGELGTYCVAPYFYAGLVLGCIDADFFM